MKVMCNQCGKILELKKSQSFAVEEEDKLKSFYFCSKEHMSKFAYRRNIKLSKD